MVSEEHQRLVNSLAIALEEQREITITSIDIDGTPEFFDEKYRELQSPADHGGIPDLQGKDQNGLIHLGEAEIDINDSNVEEQLNNFSSRLMEETNEKIPLHVIVPKEIKEEMKAKIREIGLGKKLDEGKITLWS